MLKLLGKNRHMNYYRRILLLLIVFSCAIMLPFSILTYRNAERKIVNSINQSNKSVLTQMKYNYTYYTKSMATVCLSAYFRPDVQTVLYNEQLDYNNDIYMTLKKLREDILQAQPSVTSIVLYSPQKKQWFSTDGSSTGGDELAAFFAAQQSVPKLQPVLRKIHLESSNNSVYTYVFSYFMYDYSDPKQKDGSYIVINQNANWFIDNLTSVTQEDATARIYLTDGYGNICNYKGLENIDERDRYLVKQCGQQPQEQKGNETGAQICSYGGGKYLVSCLDLASGGNNLIFIQNYNTVFADLINLKNEFLWIAGVFLISAIVLAYYLSRKLYAPVDTLVGYVSTLEGETENDEEEETDEFERLKSAFRLANETNLALQELKESSEEILRRYLLQALLADSTREEWDSLRKKMPQDPLAGVSSYHLTVLLISVDLFTKNQYGFIQEDRSLLLYSVENVMREFMEESYLCDSIQNGGKELVLIINRSEHAVKTLDQILAELREFVRTRLDITVTVSHSRTSEDPLELSSLYEEARRLGKYSMIYGPNTLLNAETCKANLENRAVTFSPELQKKLDESIRLGNLEKAEEVLELIQDGICKLNYDNIIISIMTLITHINTVVNQINLMRENSVTINYSEMYRKVIDASCIQSLFQDLIRYVRSILGETYQAQSKENDKDQAFVTAIMNEVIKNYVDCNFSVQSIADHIGLSSRYLMKKFRQCTNTSLNDYILSVRMKQAAHLLANTQIPINQICVNVGIENENYFYHLFKKYYGCTPRQFSKGKEALQNRKS